MNLFEFTDYRLYVKAWLREAKKEGRSNLTRLAATASVHPTFLSHVLIGRKDLSLEQASALSETFAHTKLEREFLFALVQRARAGTPNLRRYWDEKREELLREKNRLSLRFEEHREISDEERATFYSSWIYLAAWACTAIDNGQSSSQIAERPGLSRIKAEEVLNFLGRIGVCQERAGRFHIGDHHLHVPNESPFVVKHHMNWRMKAIQKMDTRESDELFFSAPMTISRRDFGVIRERLNGFIKEAVDIGKDSRAEHLVCLDIDFFRPEKG
jgi:uncharacterized protein (TIGR02147 family)